MVCAARRRRKAGRRLGEAKGSSSGGGSRGETASSGVTADRVQGRRRLLAFVALWLFLAGLLTALSFVVVVLVATAVLVLVAIVGRAARRPAAAGEGGGWAGSRLLAANQQFRGPQRKARSRTRARAMATEAP